MDSTYSQDSSLVVGISRSRASSWALAWAAGEARRRGMRLLLVHVFRPAFFPLPAADPRVTGAPYDPNADREAAGNRLIWAAVEQAVGRMPRDVPYEEVVIPGRAAKELALIAHGGDVLVLGSRHRGWLRRLAPGSVARACSRRAECPVVVVPEPSPVAIAAALPAGALRDRRHRWVPGIHWNPGRRHLTSAP